MKKRPHHPPPSRCTKLRCEDFLGPGTDPLGVDIAEVREVLLEDVEDLLGLLDVELRLRDDGLGELRRGLGLRGLVLLEGLSFF